MQPTTIGRSSPWVISVWPPTSATPSSPHAPAIWSKMVSTSAASVACLGQQQRGQEPARRRARAGDVVGVDVHRVPADLVGGEGDRVGLGHQVALAQGDHGGIVAQARAEQDALVRPGEVDQQPGQVFSR